MNLDTRLRNRHGQSSMTTTRWHAPRAHIKAAFAQSCQMPQYRAIALRGGGTRSARQVALGDRARWDERRRAGGDWHTAETIKLSSVYL